jgi:hypothetical protein
MNCLGAAYNQNGKEFACPTAQMDADSILPSRHCAGRRMKADAKCEPLVITNL